VDKRDINEAACTEGFFAEPLAGDVVLAHHEDHSLHLGRVRPAEGPMMPGERLLRYEAGRFVSVPLGQEGNGMGPARVNNAAYRDGWGRIFGGRAVVGQA
jgi:hypothetical protein